MFKRLLTALFVVVATVGFASTSKAQHMFMDTNGDGIYDPLSDILNENCVPTLVDIYLVTDFNLDTSPANTAACDGFPLTFNSYAVNLEATGGTVQFSGWLNNRPEMQTNFFAAGFQLNPSSPLRATLGSAKAH